MKIRIPVSEEELEEFRNGKSFDWRFDEVDLVMEEDLDV